MPTRQKTYYELVQQRTPANARTDIDVFSKLETNSLISAIPVVDLAPYTLLTTTQSISGNLLSQINLKANTSVVADISGAFQIDLNNLDVSLTEKIASDCVQSAGISGSDTTVIGYLNVTINGVSYKLGLI